MKQASRVSSDQLAQLFEKALTALWLRAYFSIGDVTLKAIVDRVLYVATEKFSVFGSLESDANGVNFGEFRQRASSISDSELREAIQFVLVELLTVVGNLTADILTPALHSELLNITVKDLPSKQSGEGKL